MISTINLLLIIIVIPIVIIAVSIVWPLIMGAAWSPTSIRIVDRMLEITELKKDDIVYDLGSGDGRIVMRAARKYGAKGVGVEVDPLRMIWSKIAVRITHLNGKVKIIWGNIFHQNISSATVVTLFLWQRTNRNLEEKLLNELKPGTRVVSYIWTFDDWTPARIDRINRVYLYVVGQN